MSTYELITELADAQRLAEEWDALALAASNPVAAPAWALSWWRHVAPADIQARILAIRDGSELIGLGAFYIASVKSGVVEHRLMASDFGVCVQPLALPGREWEVAQELARGLAGAQPRSDVVGFGPMAIASPWAAAIGAAWSGPLRAPVRQHRLEGAPVIVMPEGGYEQWFDSLSSKMRRELRRSERLFEQAGGTIRWSTAATLRADAEEFARLHGARWDERGWSRLSGIRGGLPDWLEDLGRELIEQRRFGMCMLEIDGRAICADFHLSAGTELSAVNVGWDQAHAKLAPAKLAVLSVVREAYAKGASRIALGNGSLANKVRLANGDDPVAWTIVIAPTRRLPLSYGVALPLLLRARAREAAKHLPERWVEAVRARGVRS